MAGPRADQGVDRGVGLEPVTGHPDPVGAYRQAVERGEPPVKILRAARECQELSLEEAVPALLAMTKP